MLTRVTTTTTLSVSDVEKILFQHFGYTSEGTTCVWSVAQQDADALVVIENHAINRT